MKTKLIRLAVSSAFGVTLLTACGGGDDDLSGGQTAFRVVPTEFTLTGNGACVGVPVLGPRVQIIGGSPPYQIFSTLPGAVLPDRSVVEDQGGYFEVVLQGGCYENITVTVRDVYNRTAEVTFSSEEGTAPTP